MCLPPFVYALGPTSRVRGVIMGEWSVLGRIPHAVVLWHYRTIVVLFIKCLLGLPNFMRRVVFSIYLRLKDKKIKKRINWKC